MSRYMFLGRSTDLENLDEELTWGIHVNKIFLEIIEAVYVKDKKLLDLHSRVYNPDNDHIVTGRIVFMYPFGVCANFEKYDPDKEFMLQIDDNVNAWVSLNHTHENMLVFITDPAMLTFSSIDLQSHQGNQMLGLKKYHSIYDLKKDYETIYDVEVELKDSDNPAEEHSCSQSSYADCLDNEINEIFSKVN